MEQTKIDSLNYECNGIVITFIPLPRKHGCSQEFEFIVKGNKELTYKLMSCVKNKSVVEESIPFCSAALFKIIEEGKFPELISKEEYQELLWDFECMFDEDPIFEIEDLCEENKPHFKATIKDPFRSDLFEGEGRSKDEARGRALQKLSESYEMSE